jgi:hypothetical protein
MVAETPMKSSAGDAAAPLAVARSTGEALVDAFTLAELQVQLAEVDLRDAWRRLTRGLILVSAGAVLGISTIPPTLLGIAYALADATTLELWVSLLITGGVALLIAAGLFAWGWRAIKRRGALFARSRAELRQNAKWFKSMLRQSSTRFRRSNGSPLHPDHFSSH